MNKNITLLILLIFLNKIKSGTSPITTTLKPLSGNPFITMINSNGSTTPSSIKIGNTIIIGDGSNTITLTPNNNIAHPIILPLPGETNVLGIDELGQLITTFITRLGRPGENEINCPKNEDILIKTTNNHNILIHTSGLGNINFIGSEITFGGSGDNLLLAITPSGNVISADQPGKTYYIGNTTENYINLNNTVSQDTLNGIELNTASTNFNITINAGLGNIQIKSNNVITPSSPNYSVLGIDSNNSLVTFSSTTPLFCGDLTATGSVTLGNYSETHNTGNKILVPTTGNILLISGTGDNIVLNANGTASSIKFFGTHITAPSSLNPLIILALDSNNNLTTSNGNEIYIMGNNAINKNYITVDNSGVSGITINGVSHLKNTGFLLPGINNTASLTIDSNGKIGIVISSKNFKENIKPLTISRESFNQLNPTQYFYKESQKLEYGLIAEEVYENNELRPLVIMDQKNTPLSVNYNALSVVVAEQLIQDRKINEERIKNMSHMIIELKKEIELLKKINHAI